MTPFIILVGFALRFWYVFWQAGELEQMEGNINSPAHTRKSDYFPYFSFTSWAVMIFAAAFWGLTSRPYHSDSWWNAGDNASLWLMAALAIALGLTYGVIYRLGKLHATRSYMASLRRELELHKNQHD